MMGFAALNPSYAARPGHESLIFYPRSATIWPPSTTMVVPAMKRPASETRSSKAPSRSRSSPPPLLRQLDRAVGMRHAGIVDQDGDGAEGFLRCVERAGHGGTIEHVGFDRDGAAASSLDARLRRRQPISAARHQRDRGARL